MKIISKFKDYYDFESTIYGVDNSICYERDKIKQLTEEQFNKFSSSIKSRSLSRDKHFIIRYISICGSYYPVYSYKGSTYKFIDRNTYELIFTKSDYSFRSNNYSDWITEIKQKSTNLIQLHKLLDTPIFEVDCIDLEMYEGRRTINDLIFKPSPKLSDLGIASIYPSGKLYMDLCYFITNIMKDSPDTKPPIEISDKDKIVGKGFDIKQSFRHRI